MLVKLTQRCDRSSRSVSVNSQHSAVNLSRCIQQAVPLPSLQSPHISHVIRRGTPTTSETDCAAVCTSARGPV